MPRVVARHADRVREGFQYLPGHDSAGAAFVCVGSDVFYDHANLVARYPHRTRLQKPPQ